MTRTPHGGAILRARSDRQLIRSTHRSERFVLIELQAPPAPERAGRDPVNLAFVLDRSGSMSGQKIGLAKRAVETAVERLLPSDQFAIVCYDDRVDVVVEATSASAEAKANAIARLRSIDARGSTDLGSGWMRGAEQVALGLVANPAGASVNRVLLLTDGLANVGLTDPAELTRHASELRARGVTTTTFGVGEDFDETLLQSMAQAGGGHFYFIADAVQIADHIATEVGELLAVVARDVAVEVTVPDGVELRSLSPYPLDSRGHRRLVQVGDLMAEQQLEVVLRVKFPYGPIGSELGLLVGVIDRDGVLLAAGATPVGVGWRYEDDASNDAQPRDRAVDRVVARLFAAHARQEAVKLNRLGEYGEAVGGLQKVARKIAGYAAGDAELGAIVAELKAEEARWAAPAPELDRKVAFAASSYALRSRAPDGRARR